MKIRSGERRRANEADAGTTRRAAARAGDAPRNPELAESIAKNSKGEVLLTRSGTRFAAAAKLRRTGRRHAQKGGHLHRVPAHAGVPARILRADRVRREGRAFNGTNTDPASGRSTSGGWSSTLGRIASPARPRRQAGGDRRVIPRPGDDHDRDRGRRRRDQPPVLQPGGELRSALEPPADRAANRSLPPLRPEVRRRRRELPQQAQRRRPARL